MCLTFIPGDKEGTNLGTLQLAVADAWWRLGPQFPHNVNIAKVPSSAWGVIG